MRWIVAVTALGAVTALVSCGGGDSEPGQTATPTTTPTPTPTPAPSGTPTVPSDVAPKLATDMGRSFTRLASLEAGAVFVANPGPPFAAGVTGAADTSTGTPPNTFTFSGTYDGKSSSGLVETTVDGRMTFANDPTDFNAGFNGAQGRATVNVDVLALMHVYHATIDFSLGMAEHRASSGRVVFTNPLTGTSTTLLFDPNDPLTIKLADGTATAKPNACAHSLNGSARVNVASSGGTLSSLYGFSYGSSSAHVTATFTDASGRVATLPDTDVELGCAGNNNINDWNGRFRIQWGCLPREHGEFNTTIAAKNGTTLSMIDEGDTAADAYEAAVIGSSPRAVRGYFIDGPTGSRYREDFNWTLNLDNSGFSQSSRYVYFEGPNAGKGGICVARATRIQ